MSEKYFEFTGETKVWCGITLNRIRATKDLPKHGVKKGDLGGWVEKEAQVYGNAWVSVGRLTVKFRRSRAGPIFQTAGGGGSTHSATTVRPAVLISLNHLC